MDSRIGLDYIVENREYVEKLGAALDTKNGTVKKQVFELLSALSAYSKDGYSRALETLDNYKELKDERYRFKIVVLELENTTTIEYQIALLQFINCIIISTKQLQDRIRIRNEFIGLTLLPILNKLRREATNFPDLGVQLDVFDEQRECDEAQSLQGPDGINLNSHLDVFYAIYNQVADTRQEIPFLNILQHLLRIDSKEAVSDIIWDTAETLLHRATLLENREDSARLLRSPSISHFQCPYCRGDPSSPSQRKQSLSTSHLIPASPLMPPSSSSPQACAPPPPPPPPSISAPPPPPPPMFSGGSIPNAPPPAPPPNFLQAPTDHDGISRPKTPECPIDPISRLPQQETPVPKSKMKTINWNKIPPNKVMGRHNIWSIVADSHKKSPMADMDWAEMEGLFCQQPTSGQGSPKLGRDTGGNGDTLERKSRKENSEITLLDGKRSLNVNIFLKQFRSTNEDIVQLIHEGDHDSIGAEKLRGLLKILPEIDELDVLKSFDGDKNRLGNAEKFLLQLTQVPNYKLRIESMLLKEEFTANLSYLEPNINVMLYTGEELMNNKLLQEVLYMIVVAGNFLNSGGYAGNAAGVKLSSLQKLTDIRANKPGMNLIHYVALQAEKKNKELLTFTNELTGLENSSKISVEQLNNEITTLETRTKKICRQVDLPNTDCDIKVQMVDFLAAAETHIAMLQDGIAEIDKLRLQLSDFFCEDPATFKLEECFKIFHNFSEKFKQAVNENERRRIQEEQANQRRKMREEQMARKRQSSSTPVSDFENGLTIDSSYYELRSSPAMNRRNVRNGEAILNGKREDGGPSPDITPNGSLRRRRSRVLSEEDDGLMDYLRSSGHDSGTRERKSTSYGSLDRSWARRARTGNSKNRPALLSVDFNADRERPTSPSQNIDAQQLSTPSTPEDNKPRGPRGWQQRIESWIQTNEQDEKQNDDYTKRASERRRKSSSIRRSFENDSENERKLDPLPEEEHRRPHHSDWNPSSTLDKTDVVGALEAIEDAQPHHTPISKDKSLLRKSNLNVSNCTGDTTETTRNRTIPSSSSSSPSTPLHSIIEEDRRRIFIHQLGERGASDRLKIYIRRPSNETSALVTGGDQELNINKSNEIIPNNSSSSNNNKQVIYIKSQQDAPSLASVAKKSLTPHLSYHPLNNNSEIDSDNIETPPVMRKHIGGGRSADHEIIEKKNLINPPDQEILGDGQFDRFSSTRRTRRVKRPINNSSGAEEKLSEYENVKLHEIDAPQIILDGNDSIKIIQTAIPTMVETTESRMKRWQEKKAMKAIDNDEALMQAKLIRNTRHLTSINQKDVQDAKQNLKSPTEIPERICFDRRQSIELNVTKPIIQELNDEGFEETQSLVSDTPSQGKDSTSSCNDGTDAKLLDKAQTQRVNLLRRHGSERLPKRITPQKPSMNSLLTKNQDLIQHRTIRGAPISTTPSPAARRENQLRKTDSSGSLRRSITPSLFNNIERSNSRASLRSSRSSLNSGVSTNTIKKMPSKVSSNLKKSLSADSPAKRPLNVQNNHNKSNTRVPASRSSSSGSSIGANQNSRRPPTSSPSKILSSASFKENRRSVAASPNHQQKSSSSSNVPSANASPIKSQSSTTSQNNSTGSVVRRTGGFMRATTASATKVNGARGK